MTTKSEISTRQLGIMIFYAFCGLKFINLASLLYQKIEDTSFVVVLFLALVDALIFVCILTFIKRHPGASFYDYLSCKVGVICAKIIYFLIFFLLFDTFFIIYCWKLFIFARCNFFNRGQIFLSFNHNSNCCRPWIFDDESIFKNV